MISQGGEYILSEGRGDVLSTHCGRAQVDVSYDIFAGEAPTTQETGTQAGATSGAGIFHDENDVNLADDIASANVGARDLATNTTAVASI